MFEEITSPDNVNINNGFSGGISVQVPIKKDKGSFIGVDYTYRESLSFNGNHTIGIIFNF